ncbi:MULTISPECIES: response regulator transcription factor [Kordiimonas]|jgi:DNA-binding response OmpR family regulator|uniref:DNA-binding response regulator, OmpR family, contains REC and winged-helix (WHTH) domain n=1 Tax=Kordiimonas lacus TaxID=637679 RepID=A0A1G7AAU6_9PROT|nr:MULTISPECIES: response regulator transcription factor [Kordiimonas]SDE10996.1 DNA-binding response regulator, OmpR family, contains REC and winged-helix (wHTH) domain [Kordiimonas lacus]
MRILIVEDNLDIQANIADYLEDTYSLDFAYSGDQGLSLALENEYDVIVLDLMLPGRDGLDVCAAYRQAAGLQAPIIMLTARDTIDDKEAGFDAGADDYLVKPFSLRELKMRIEALTRRPKARQSTERSFAGLSFDAGALTVSVKDQSVVLHEKEARILGLLLDAAPDVVTSATISYALWGDEPPESGALRTHIYNLRKALGSLGLGDLLKTRRGKGYALEQPS